MNNNVKNVKPSDAALERLFHVASHVDDASDFFVDFYLKYGAEALNSVDSQGDTALMRACYHGKINNVKKLVEDYDVHINHQNKYGSTALHFAIKSNEFDVIHYLLTRDNINYALTNDQGHNALLYAQHTNGREYGVDTKAIVESLIIQKEAEKKAKLIKEVGEAFHKPIKVDLSKVEKIKFIKKPQI